MIDIHCHLLYGVDDGAQTFEQSVAMMRAAREQGVEIIILTPHYRHGMFAYPQETIWEHYTSLGPIAKELGMLLALGTEYHMDTNIIESLERGRCRTLGGSRYVLCEFSYSSDFSYLCTMTQELVLHGYIPVIAHAERCGCLVADPVRSNRLRELGAWIQLNADAVLGLEGQAAKRFCKKLLREDYVDVIASDSHGLTKRACHLGKCRQVLSNKFGEEYVGKLFYGNPAKIILDARNGGEPSG
jgi:protein-tyrosine phosphatase